MTRRLLVAAVAVLAASSCSSPNPYYDPKKPHHTERGFRNTDATAIAPRPFGEFLRWQRERWSLEIPPPKVDLSANVPDLGRFSQEVVAHGDHVAWAPAESVTPLEAHPGP